MQYLLVQVAAECHWQGSILIVALTDLKSDDCALTGPRRSAALQGLISGVPTGALVMLDLYAEVQPQWARTQGFYGAPFIWCMLHNFGGNLGAHPARAHLSQSASHGIECRVRASDREPAPVRGR